MLKRLFGSETRINLLRLFMFNPKDEYYPRQIQRITEDIFENIRKELINLESLGLLKSRTSGRQKYYSVCTNHPLFVDLKAIIFKTTGMSQAIEVAIKNKEDIDIAFIYGSYAKNSEDVTSDIDIFIIGGIPSKEFRLEVSKLERDSLREINYVIFSKKELKERIKKKEHFVSSVLKQPKIFIRGTEDELRKLVGDRKD